MGRTALNIEVANAGNPGVTETVEFLIDSGAVYSIVPRPVLQRLGVLLGNTCSDLPTVRLSDDKREGRCSNIRTGWA